MYGVGTPRGLDFKHLPINKDNMVTLFVLQPYSSQDGCIGFEMVKLDLSQYMGTSPPVYLRMMGWMEEMQ